MRKSILLCIFVSVLHSGLSLRCYECDSEDDLGCTENLNTASTNINIVECGKDFPTNPLHPLTTFLQPNFNETISYKYGQEFVCMTLIATRESVSGVNYTIIGRGCIPDTHNCTVLMQSLHDKGFTHTRCRTCNRDLCNSSFAITSSSYLIAFILLLIAKTF
uniref:Uncharacterized protein n=1 Tax=Xenopsylla cheopis TaxID=163159 RepID=A0A6M2E0I9_XENCH